MRRRTGVPGDNTRFIRDDKIIREFKDSIVINEGGWIKIGAKDDTGAVYGRDAGYYIEDSKIKRVEDGQEVRLGNDQNIEFVSLPLWISDNNLALDTELGKVDFDISLSSNLIIGRNWYVEEGHKLGAKRILILEPSLELGIERKLFNNGVVFPHIYIPTEQDELQRKDLNIAGAIMVDPIMEAGEEIESDEISRTTYSLDELEEYYHPDGVATEDHSIASFYGHNVFSNARRFSIGGGGLIANAIPVAEAQEIESIRRY